MKQIVVDWGSSSFRAYLIDGLGTAVAQRENDRGVLAHSAGEFHRTLVQSCGDWLERWPGIPVLMSGMVGSRNGWLETPYVPCPADARALCTGFSPLTRHPELNIHIAPGVRCVSPGGAADVMRGEETQVFGALRLAARESALLLLPGTHSKWVRAEGGRIETFSTFFTGELFALLCEHSSIGSVLQAGDFDADEFVRGLEYSGQAGGPLHQIFSTRTRSLCEGADSRALHSYLSGILIGGEFSAALAMYRPEGESLLVASGKLQAPYQLAGEFFGCSLQPLDPGLATARGLAAIGEYSDIRSETC